MDIVPKSFRIILPCLSRNCVFFKIKVLERFGCLKNRGRLLEERKLISWAKLVLKCTYLLKLV